MTHLESLIKRIKTLPTTRNGEVICVFVDDLEILFAIIEKQNEALNNINKHCPPQGKWSPLKDSCIVSGNVARHALDEVEELAKV